MVMMLTAFLNICMYVGSFGKVFLVRDKQSNKLFAMKVLKKDYIFRKNQVDLHIPHTYPNNPYPIRIPISIPIPLYPYLYQVEHTKTERNVLGYIHHPFIVGLNMAFQTGDKLFFVLDYCAGGELFFHLGKVSAR
ncbi:hypothetical protein EON63_19630 [archaeon]|nr:MAG: hypothetical protein EON63_19630 [archaeon]